MAVWQAETESIPGTGPSGRERVVRAAYDLFSRRGVRAVGVDAVISEANVAKMTLYRNFGSKDDLILAFLRRRAELWTDGWLRAEAANRADSPAGQLLVMFDIFDEWFHEPEFEGCVFVTTMLEYADRSSQVRQASVEHLAEIRHYLRQLATEAGIEDADGFSHQWHILMKGSIIAAGEGDVEAARRARVLGELLLRSHHIDPVTSTASRGRTADAGSVH
jgi:AcrR family transcriptional regulator